MGIDEFCLLYSCDSTQSINNPECDNVINDFIKCKSNPNEISKLEYLLIKYENCIENHFKLPSGSLREIIYNDNVNTREQFTAEIKKYSVIIL